MNLDIVTDHIVANLNCGLPWSEWAHEEQSLFALSLHEKGTSSRTTFQKQRRDLLRKLFNRLDIVEVPLFLGTFYKTISNKERYKLGLYKLRLALIKKALPRNGTLPPIF
jgi:hypothetical protein